ncbi:DUF6659 family protein [Candidatus Nitrosotenuis uzonensis]
MLLQEREILFAGLINKNGKIISGGFKPGINLIGEFEREMVFMEHVLMATMNKDFDGCLGRILYTVSKREKVIMINFSIGSFLFLVAVDPMENVDKEVTKIQKSLDNLAFCV